MTPIEIQSFFRFLKKVNHYEKFIHEQWIGDYDILHELSNFDPLDKRFPHNPLKRGIQEILNVKDMYETNMHVYDVCALMKQYIGEFIKIGQEDFFFIESVSEVIAPPQLNLFNCWKHACAITFSQYNMKTQFVQGIREEHIDNIQVLTTKFPTWSDIQTKGCVKSSLKEIEGAMDDYINQRVLSMQLQFRSNIGTFTKKSDTIDYLKTFDLVYSSNYNSIEKVFSTFTTHL